MAGARSEWTARRAAAPELPRPARVERRRVACGRRMGGNVYGFVTFRPHDYQTFYTNIVKLQPWRGPALGVRAHRRRGFGTEQTAMYDENVPRDWASEKPARSRRLNRAKASFSRAVRMISPWCRGNQYRSLPERQAALSLKLRGPYASSGLSGSAPRRWTPSSSPPGSTTSPRSSGWLKHVTVVAFIVLSGNAAAYHDYHWCLGGTKFVDMTDCVVWENHRNKHFYAARNICNEYVNLTVCWTGNQYQDITYKCDKSHPIPPATYGGMKPGESAMVPKGEFVWWAHRCEE